MNTSPESQCRAFATDLRRLRREHGLSQEHFARMLGIKAPYLSALEHARKPPPNPHMAARVSCALQMQAQKAAEFEEAARRARVAWKEWLDAKRSAARSLAGVNDHVAVDELTLSVSKSPLASPTKQPAECRFEVTISVRQVEGQDTGTAHK